MTPRTPAMLAALVLSGVTLTGEDREEAARILGAVDENADDLPDYNVRVAIDSIEDVVEKISLLQTENLADMGELPYLVKQLNEAIDKVEAIDRAYDDGDLSHNEGNLYNDENFEDILDGFEYPIDDMADLANALQHIIGTRNL